MSYEITRIAIKLGITLLLTPWMGWVMMVCAEQFEAIWKKNNRKKKIYFSVDYTATILWIAVFNFLNSSPWVNSIEFL